ncbi:MAG: uroporphyrinogen-III synthase [Bacteroidetes bacterium HGW-Bacteroidetes-21]|nr:MAG: uroporphyrinogen-III synthase [Bacteroidetes bacterium HGW-Bacteroidetes-21]
MKVKRVLISQPAPQTEKSPYFDIAGKYGLKMDFKPFIQTEGISVKEFRQQRINLSDYTAVVFSSRTAVDHFFRICEETRYVVPDTMKYFCVTEATAFYLQKYVVYRKRKIFYGNNVFEDLIEYFNKHKEERYLVPLSDPHKPDIPKTLDKLNLKYSKGIFYKTIHTNMSEMNMKDYEVIVFFSPIGIKSLFTNFPDFQQNGTIIGAFGPTTVKAAQDAGLTVQIKAPTPETPSMTAAIEHYLKTNCK